MKFFSHCWTKFQKVKLTMRFDGFLMYWWPKMGSIKLKMAQFRYLTRWKLSPLLLCHRPHWNKWPQLCRYNWKSPWQTFYEVVTMGGHQHICTILPSMSVYRWWRAGSSSLRLAVHETGPNDLFQFDYMEFAPTNMVEKYVQTLREDNSACCWLFASKDFTTKKCCKSNH